MSYKIDYKTKSGSFELYVDDKKAVEYFKKKVKPIEKKKPIIKKNYKTVEKCLV